MAAILVADDDRAIRTVLSQVLARDGHSVRSTGTAAQLWQWVDDGQGDLVITDEPWEDDHEIVPLDLIDRVVGPGGPIPVAEARLRTDCPVAPELFR